MTVLDELLGQDTLSVVYDGECPFCSAYVEMLRLRQSVGTVRLVDAREYSNLVTECRLRGFLLDDGMLAIYGGRPYFGSDAVILLSQLTTASGIFNRAAAAVLSKPFLARLCYPVMKAGRKATLKIIGRTSLAG